MGQVLEVKKEMLDYLLMRHYPNDRLNKLSIGYKEQECYDWTEERIDETFNVFEKLVGFIDEDSSANREIWYYRGYRDAITNIKKKL